MSEQSAIAPAIARAVERLVNPQVYRPPNIDVAARLEAGGYARQVAGPDFDRVVEGFRRAFETRNGGVLLIGPVGCGKTTAVRAMFSRPIILPVYDRVVMRSMLPEAEDGNDYKHAHESRTVVLDDIGSEPEISLWGVKVRAVAEWVMAWYDWHAVGGHPGRLCVTTNIGQKSLDELAACNLYGDRVVSRLLSMCVVVRLTGSDHRRPLGMV